MTAHMQPLEETNKRPKDTSLMPRVETTGSLGESLIWDCRAQVHARDPTPTLVHFL